jgi:DNA modification methylase
MKDWNIQKIKLADLKAATYNPRTISDEAMAGLSHSIERFGMVQPIVWNKRTGNIVGGHQRFKVLAEKGVAETDVVVVDMDTNEEIALNVTLNNPSIQGEFTSSVGELLKDLAGQLGDGFEELRLNDLKKSLTSMIKQGQDPVDAEPQISKADELNETWKVETGQLWKLGQHRLLCGDSTKVEDVKRVMGGEKATLIFTDPPYGVSVAAKNKTLNEFKNKRGRSGGSNETTIVDDDLPPDELLDRLIPAFVNMRQIVMSDDCTVMVTAPQGGELCMMMNAMKAGGLTVRHVLIWKKNQPTFSMNRLDYDYQHEPILLTWLKKHKRPLNGKFKTSIWEIDKPTRSAEHPTMKPVELVVNCVMNHTDEGDVIFDAYDGSGTSIMAAQQTGRKCRAIEISPAYVAVALQRFKDATGETPELVKE